MATKLDAINSLYIREYIPAIVAVIIVIVIGLAGNMFALIYYGFKAQKSVVQFFLLMLSLNDFITNFAYINDVVDLFFTVKYFSAFACQFFYAVKHWLVGNSLLFMVAIAIDRHRRVCRPFTTQFTVRIAKYLIIGFSLYSLVLAVRTFATADIIRINVTTVENSTKGYFCTTAIEGTKAYIESIFGWIDIITHATIITSLIVFYSLVIRGIIKSKRRVKSHCEKTSIFKLDSLGVTHMDISSTDTCETSTNVGRTQDNRSQEKDSKLPDQNASEPSNIVLPDKASTLSTESVLRSGNVSTLSKVFRRKKKRSKSSKAELRITIMVTVITLASITCFVPYFLSILLVSNNLSGNGLILGVTFVILRRTYMINSAINPVIMVIFNNPFRQFVAKTVCNSICKRSTL